jgi:hypothetical protein
MNLHHAAALALVGWYLMVPPLTSDNKIHDAAPIAEWQILDSFDTAQHCDDTRFRLMDASENTEAWRHERALRSACISTDDLRLKPK